MDEKSKRGRPIAAVARGVAFGYAVILALFAVMALLVTYGALPESALGGVTLLCSLVGGFAGSIAAIRAVRRRPLLFGCAVGGAMFVLTVLTRALRASDKVLGGLTASLFLAFLVGSCMGSLVCARKRSAKRSKLSA
jgi:putative membrane protein (TIGR04086 family)